MKDLIRSSVDTFNYSKNFTHFCLADHLFGVTEDKQIVLIDLENQTKPFDVLCSLPIQDSSVYIVSFNYIYDNLSLCLFLSDGSIWSYDASTDNLSNVINIESKIIDVAFSPDLDLVTIIAGNDTFLLMQCDLTLIVENNLYSESLGCQIAQNVGWGSKSTQFHGSEGKSAAKRKTEIDESVSAEDDLKPRCHWKGDSYCFAISSVDVGTNCRKIRIWSRDGILQYTCESVSRLGHLIAWKPIGNILVASQKLETKHDIIFFEKNGLRHGGFSLPEVLKEMKLHTIRWSTDGHILALFGQLASSDEKSINHVLLLWTQSNYHWYLKQYYKFPENSGISSFFWLDEQVKSNMGMLISLKNGNCLRLSWFHKSNSVRDVVAVTDGDKVLLSRFSTGIVPPPMASNTLQCDDFISCTFVSETNQCLALLASNKMILYELSKTGYVQSRALEITDICTNHFITSIFLYQNLIYFAKSAGGDTSIYKADLIDKDFKCPTFVASFPSSIVCLASNNLGSLLAFQLSDLTVYEFKDTEQSSSSKWIDNLGVPVVYREKCRKLMLVTFGNSRQLVAFTVKGCLYVDNKILENEVTSAFVTDRFLVYTTLSNQLHCLLIEELDDILVDAEKRKILDEPRSVELGSVIVAAVESKGLILLQLPRGNLEGVYPRALIVDLIKQAMIKQDYQKAFKLMKQHRINLNLMIDHDLESFISNIDKVITEVGKNPQDLCLIISELSEDRVTNTLYRFAYFDSKHHSTAEQSKVDTISLAFHDAINRIDIELYLLPLLHTFIKRTKTDIDGALTVVKNLTSIKNRDDAIKYLYYLLDFDQLFASSLGTYDFDIVSMVVQRSSKDPKEVNAISNRFRNLSPESYKRAQIDTYLKRNESALCHLRDCINQLNPSDEKVDKYLKESLQIMQNQSSIYRKAVDIFSTCEEKVRKTIWKAFADHLLTKRYFEEAGIAYLRCEEVENAMKAFQLSGNWNAVVELISNEHRKSIDASSTIKSHNHSKCLMSLAANLTDNHRSQEAAYVYEVLINDKQAAFNVLLNDHHWDQAKRLLALLSTESRSEMLRTFDKELTDAYDECVQSIELEHKNLNGYFERFALVKEARETTTVNRWNGRISSGVTGHLDEDDDTISDTSSVLSSYSGTSKRSNSTQGSSLATRTSAKRKGSKKAERTKYKLKEGSPREYEALVFVIKESIVKLDKQQEPNGSLIKHLYLEGFANEASHCQAVFDAALSKASQIVSTIWPSDLARDLFTASQPHPSCENIRDFTDLKLLIPPDIRVVYWKLALLG